MSSFIQHCESLFSKIKQNRPIQECQNAAAIAAAADPYEPIWFVYYMFFAIHNPKMEEYIHKKASAASAASAAVDIASVIKNMIRRRQYTSTIVYQLYTHAYTNNGNVTHIYPKYKQIHEIVVKSYNSNHLKTTAVHIRRAFAATATAAATATTATVTAPAVISSLIEHITATATATVAYDAKTILQKINNIQYKRKDIIFLALICYLKLDEEDINTKAIFIAATSDDITATTTATTTTTAIAQPEPEAFAPSHYDNKYKYLYR
jgi:hypothetical protein